MVEIAELFDIALKLPNRPMAGEKLLAQDFFGAVRAFEAHVLELKAQELDRGEPGLHLVEHFFRNPALGDGRAQQGNLGRGNALRDRRQSLPKAELELGRLDAL